MTGAFTKKWRCEETGLSILSRYDEQLRVMEKMS